MFLFRKTREGCNCLFQNPPTEGGDKVQGSVDPRFAAGLPFPVPEILELTAFRDLETFTQHFSPNFPAIFQGTKKTNKHKQLLGIVLGMDGGQICLCVALL